MSEILDLAKSFNEKSKVQAENIEKEVQSAMQTLSDVIKKELNESESTILQDIKESNQRHRKAVLGSWKYLLWTLIAVITILLAIIAYQVYRINWRSDLIEAQKETLKILRKEGEGMTLSYCTTDDGERKICAVIDQKYVDRSWGKEGRSYKILKIDKRGD